jgi:two-component system chemotaxis sensor kinase CheA
MDVVRSNMQKIGGEIDIDTQIGRGTTFTLRLPLTLAIIPALLVSVRHRKQDSILALPLNAVLETVRLRNGSRPTVRQREVLDLRGRVLPLLRLGQVLFEEDGDQGSGIRDQGPGEDFQSAVRHPPSDWVVIARAGGQEVGLVVDALLGQEEIVIKSLGGFLGNLRGLAGCTLLGDGRIALIVDLAHLVRPAERRMARWN